MILTVTLNAALDVTYQVPGVDWDGVNRVAAVHRRAGGKGVNVARVLAALGQDVLVTGLAGGPTGQTIEADLQEAGLPHAFVGIAADSRTTLVVADSPRTASARTALFNEPGPEVTAAEFGRMVGRFTDLMATAEAVVISGSLPRGVPLDAYATLAAIAAEHGVPAIVDADGEPLRHAPGGRPSIVKPNAEELARAVPEGGPEEGAQALRGRGAESVVVSMGAEGLLAVTPEGIFRARMPYKVEGNPTGAGDSLVAGLALGLVERSPWPERLTRAAALGAAAVAAPVAGDFDRDVYADIHPRIVIV
ncbi:MAG TPA: 1-phosphofructokinase family hexose kinase [Nonomuraea sp.]|nr:1-phosphofructokinase family hexose kinase [Nonomuraea sp.]